MRWGNPGWVMGPKGTPVCAGGGRGGVAAGAPEQVDGCFSNTPGTRLHHLCVRTAEGTEQGQPLGDSSCAALGLQGCLQWGFLGAKVFLMARGQHWLPEGSMAGTHTAADPGTVLTSWQCWLWCPQDRAFSGCSWVCGPLASVAGGNESCDLGRVSVPGVCLHWRPWLGHSQRS